MENVEIIKWLLDLVILALGTFLWQDYKDTKSLVKKNKDESKTDVDRYVSIVTDLRLKTSQDLAELAAQSAKELSDYRLHVAEHYPNHEYLSKVMESMLTAIRDISVKIDKWGDKLDNKVDKE